MRRLAMKGWLVSLTCVFLLVMAMASPSSTASAQAVVVGRVYTIVGDLLRYVPEENDWVAVARDAPFGTDDTLFSGSRGMAELVVPNGSWIRIGYSTQIQFIALDTDLSEVDVATGMARFYNKSSSTVIKATSPFGYVLAYPGAIFDFYVGENSVEVVPVRGSVDFVYGATNARYNVTAGYPSILADWNHVSSGEGTVDVSWDRWNMTRDNFWAAKARKRGRSATYLPASLQSEAYTFEENGRWERVPYEGSSRWFWRPTTVASGWSPFTMGRWTEWDGDQCWIPDEPFGYVTHHYGNWIYAQNAWYWAPPVASVRVGLPLLNIGFFWYPGRVSWIHSGSNVGWVPLAPQETYYSHRNWGGPRVVVVNNVNITRININIRSYAYANHAIIVPQENFSRVNNYRTVRITNTNTTTIINNYRAAPVINNTVINNYTTNNQRFNSTNVTVNEKPHKAVIERIQKNETTIRAGRKEDAAVITQQVKKLPEGKINREIQIEQPKVTNRIVPANEANRPKEEIKFPQREVKGSEKAAPQTQPTDTLKPVQQPTARPPLVGPARTPEQVKPAQKSEQVKPTERPEPLTTKPQQPAQTPSPAARPERVAPEKLQSSPPGQPVARPDRGAPVKPAEPAQAAPKSDQVRPQRPEQQAVQPPQPAPQVVKPERIAPAKPQGPPQATPPQQPVSKVERTAPTKPVEPAQPTERPEQIKLKQRPEQPTQPVQVAPPVAKPERVAPAKPLPAPQSPPPQQPAPKVERVTPAKPAEPAQPIPKPEQVRPQRPEQPTRPTQAAPPEAKPEHITPAKPGQRDKSQEEPEEQKKPR
jgi:hypothetical protein